MPVVVATAVTVPPLITSYPFESIPSPSPVEPVTFIFTVPPFNVVTDTPSSFVLIPSFPDRMLISPF